MNSRSAWDVPKLVQQGGKLHEVLAAFGVWPSLVLANEIDAICHEVDRCPFHQPMLRTVIDNTPDARRRKASYTHFEESEGGDVVIEIPLLEEGHDFQRAA